MRTVVGLFDNPNEAQSTIDELVQLGFAPENISVITNLSSQTTMESRSSIHFDTMILNDVGKVAACGPLRAAFREGGEGLSPALRGALQRFGLESNLAEHYVSGVQHGETLESIVVDDADADRVVAVMKRHSMPGGDELRKDEKTEEKIADDKGEKKAIGAGALAGAGAAIAAKTAAAKEAMSNKIDDLKSGRKTDNLNENGARAETPAESSARAKYNGDGLAYDEEMTIPVVQEELRVGKRRLDLGGVRLSVHTVEKPVSEQIHLRESHVEIERRMVDRPLRADEVPFRDDTLEMNEQAEEAVVSKHARLIEEVVVHKHVSDRVETVADTVRATEVDIGKLLPFDAPGYRAYFDQQGYSGAAFDDYLPAYKFGHELRDGDFNADRWEDVEPGARTRWESKRPGTWERFKDSIRYAWMKARGK